MEQNQDQSSLYMLSVAFLLLSFIYIVISIYTIYRLWQVYSNQEKVFIARVFYILIFSACFSYTLSMGYFLFEVGKDKYKENFKITVMDTIYIPDSIFFLIYLTLYWQVISLSFNAHMKSGNLIRYSQEWDPTTQASINYLQFFYFCYCLVQTIIILLFNVQKVDLSILILINLALNCLIPLSLLISEIYYNFKYSGSPFRSRNFEKKTGLFINIQHFLVSLNRLLIFIACMRIVQIALNSLAFIYFDNVFKFFTGTGDLELSLFNKIFIVVGFVADLILVSVLPFLYSLGQSFVKIFLINLKSTSLLSSDRQENQCTKIILLIYHKQELEPAIEDENLRISKLNQSSLIIGTKLKPQFKNTEDSSKLERKLIPFKISDITFKEKIKKRANGLGFIRDGYIGNQKKIHIFRVIEFKQLSTYVIEEVETHIQKINELQHEYIAHIHGYSSEPNQIVFLLKNYENGSLHDLIYDKNTEEVSQILRTQIKPLPDDSFSKLDSKLMIILQLSRGLQYLHQQQVYHGHLTPHNIMLNKNSRIKIMDIGFLPLKKYCSILFGYMNKGQYTAPEILQERGNVVVNPTPEADIYSLGMIMYEFFTEKPPFKDVNQKDISRIVIEQHGRPKIVVEEIGEEVATLIRWCWQQDPQKRPTIQNVVKALENIKEQTEVQ